MSKIKVLPEVLANQIAAGEIVERPASAAKELLENALDAGAQSVQAEVQEGGKRLIRVRDDGEGMGRDDALLAFEHHATSKIRCTEDLLAIRTLGFRGEALPAIASVSRVTLRTIPRGGDRPGSALGTEIRIHGGIIKSSREITWSQGTEVTVEDLFYNIPARRKFLKNTDTEFQNLMRLCTHYALSNPEVAFTLQHNQRTVFAHSAACDHHERMYQVLGKDLFGHLMPVDAEREGYRLSGRVGKPHESRKHPYSQFIFVNRRMVRDRFLFRAILDAYGNSLPKGSYPVVVLFLELPPEDVDVNVHPAKTEIRFHRPERVRDLVQSTLFDAFRKSVSVPSFFLPDPFRESGRPVPAPQAESVTAEIFAPSAAPADWPLVAETAAAMTSSSTAIPEEVHRTDALPSEKVYVSALWPSEKGAAADDHDPVSRSSLISERDLQSREERTSTLFSGFWTAIGQLFNTYILASDGEGLLLFDQHVAHERILFEKLLSQMEGNQLTQHRLLVPITLDLSPTEISQFDSLAPVLARAGFEAEGFGGNTIVIKAVPAILAEKDCRRFIREILELYGGDSRESGMEEYCRRLASAVACKAAIKANTSLSPEGMQILLNELRKAKHPHTCPHGRPIIFKLDRKEIEKRFQR